MMRWVAGVLVLVGVASCTEEPRELVAEHGEALAHEGPWMIPADVRATAATQVVTITEAGPWIGPSGCSDAFTSGAMVFADYLLENFPQISSYGGYDCRAIVGAPEWMSVHATGRALDLFIPVDAAVSGEGNADNDAGDAVANWLIANAEYIGVQRVIWDRWIWQSEEDGGSRDMPYDFSGSHPHNDHIHMELSVEASEMNTAFFEGPMDPPILAGCDPLTALGGVVDNSSTCFQAFGNPAYWRHVDGAGIGGSYIWTNAFSASSPSNFARWTFYPSATGRYAVEVHLVAEHAVFARTRYEVRHATGTSTVNVDQGADADWVSLGDYDFTVGTGQSLTVYDNDPGTVASSQHICVDAMRITNLDPSAVPDDGGVPQDSGFVPDDASASSDAGMLDASIPPPPTNPGCNVAKGHARGEGFLIVMALLGFALVLRRRAA